MMLPSLWGEDLFDDWMNFDFPTERDFWGKKNPLYGKHAKNLMKTDVKETDTAYEVDVDLPGFKKEELNLKLEDGYLTITAAKSLDKDEQDKDSGKYIRRERYSGSCSRTFFVGENITQEEVKARFEDGILRLEVPKKAQQQIVTNKYIPIE